MANLKDIVHENINKFSFAQMTSNNNGKTSGSGTMGIYLIIIGGLIGIMASIDALFTTTHPDASNVLLFATGAITTGAALLGYRKSKEVGSEPVTQEVVGETPPVV